MALANFCPIGLIQERVVGWMAQADLPLRKFSRPYAADNQRDDSADLKFSGWLPGPGRNANIRESNRLAVGFAHLVVSLFARLAECVSAIEFAFEQCFLPQNCQAGCFSRTEEPSTQVAPINVARGKS